MPYCLTLELAEENACFYPAPVCLTSEQSDVLLKLEILTK